MILRKRKGASKWIVGAIFGGLSLINALFLWSLGYSFVRSSVPRYVFEDTFHEKPASGTTVIRGDSSGFVDSAGKVLAFRTDRATFDRIRPADLDHVANDSKAYRFHAHSLPGWWRDPGHDTEIWMDEFDGTMAPSPTKGQRYYSECTIMTWNPDGLVQYYWEGID